MNSARYLSVNVYPGSGHWNVAILLREAGKPWPRLVRDIATLEIQYSGDDLAEAARVAALALLDYFPE